MAGVVLFLNCTCHQRFDHLGGPAGYSRYDSYGWPYLIYGRLYAKGDTIATFGDEDNETATLRGVNSTEEVMNGWSWPNAAKDSLIGLCIWLLTVVTLEWLKRRPGAP